MNLDRDLVHQSFQISDKAPIRECAYCRTDFKCRSSYDEYGDKVWVGRFCSHTCCKLWKQEQAEKGTA